MSVADDPAPDDSVLAAEYVLRLLPDAEQEAFEARLNDSQDLRSQILWWETQLGELAHEVGAVTPPPRVRSRLMRTLFDAPVAAFPNRVGFWRALNLVSLSLVAFLGYQLFIEPGPPGSAPLSLAEVAAEDGSLRVLVAYDPASGRFQVSPTAGEPLPGRVLQLWGADAENAPVSLGLLGGAAEQRVALPPELRGAGVADLHFAVSDEPPGGSPTGLPTGDVLAAGAFSDP